MQKQLLQCFTTAPNKKTKYFQNGNTVNVNLCVCVLVAALAMRYVESSMTASRPRLRPLMQKAAQQKQTVQFKLLKQTAKLNKNVL